MKPISALVPILALFCSSSWAATNPEIDAILEPIRVKHNLPSLAGAVFDTDGLFEQGATGFRRAKSDVAVTENDLWHLGSETKAMTATLAGTFVAEGKLTWDDTVEKHFPEFAKSIDPALKVITVKDLLSHRAGLIPNLEWFDFDKRNLVRARREASKKLLTSPPASKPGEFEYSNAGYVVVGSILEKLGGKSWEDLMRERIFQPLDIKLAGFGGTGTPGKLDQPWPHRENGRPELLNGPSTDNAPVLGPAGTVHMSLRGWSKFLADQLRGASGGKALMPTEIYTTIQTPSPAGSDYALGWGTGRRPWAGGKVLTHAGSNTMNFAICWLAVPKKFGVIVTTNQAGDAAEKAGDEAASALIDWKLKH